MSYLHGIETDRNASVAAILGQAMLNVQVAVGTAPVNLLHDPQSAVNKLFLCRNALDVSRYLGSSDDYNYTLMQTKYASFQVHGAAPVVMINVLDPSNPLHVTQVASQSYAVTNKMTTIAVTGILLASLVVKMGDATGVEGTDFVAAFDDDGYVDIAVLSDGAFAEATELDISYKKLNPSGVTATDIIGGVSEAGKRTGISLIDEIYSTLNVVPGILSAPVYSERAAVVAALQAKAELSGDIASAIAVVDIESHTTKKKEDVGTAKNALGASSRFVAACWPKVTVGGNIFSMSAFVAALLQSLCNNNNNIPQSPDNKDFGIEGLVLEDGTEVHMLQSEVNDYINAVGVVSGLYMNGWKCWGSNTSRYPKEPGVPNNRFIKCVMMSNYLECKFKTEYLSSIGTDASYKFIDSIVTGFNAELNALAPDYLAGAEVIFDKNENPLSSIQQGHFVFHTRYADYTPVEWIKNTFTWDIDILANALMGGES